MPLLLPPGQSTTVTISAAEFWNPTGVLLQAAQPYKLVVPPQQYWRDASIRCGPEGYEGEPLQRLFNHWRRSPHLPWFALAGTLSRKHDFLIGSGLAHFVAPVTGELVCYANDLPKMYWNNRGAIQLRISALAPTPL